MTRKKVKLAFIVNDSARKATYKKRKRGLTKKLEELTTLCDVKACAVLYSPYEPNSRPVVWPNMSGAREVISSFKRLPDMEKSKKMVSQEEFLMQRVVKAHEHLKKQQKENREKDMTQVMFNCLSGKGTQNLNLLDLSDLSYVINQNLSEITKRIETLKKEKMDAVNVSQIDASNGAIIPYPYPSSVSVVGEASQGQNEDVEMQMMMLQPWTSFMDMMAAPLEYNHSHVPQIMGVESSNSDANPINMNANGGTMIMNANGGTMNMIANGTMMMHGESSNSANPMTMNANGTNPMTMNTNGPMMMGGNLGGYQATGANSAMWSNRFFP